jgi:hypothetical protein
MRTTVTLDERLIHELMQYSKNKDSGCSSSCNGTNSQVKTKPVGDSIG